MIVGGIALCAYGVLLLIDLSEITFNKFSSDGADTSTALLTVLIGAAFALYGWFWQISSEAREDSPANEP